MLTKTQEGARVALFGSQTPSAAHFPVSFAFSLIFFFFFGGSSQVFCDAGYSFKRASERAGGHWVWPLQASSLPGIPFQLPLLPEATGLLD